jgi:hypothetical protein
MTRCHDDVRRDQGSGATPLIVRAHGDAVEKRSFDSPVPLHVITSVNQCRIAATGKIDFASRIPIWDKSTEVGKSAIHAHVDHPLEPFDAELRTGLFSILHTPVSKPTQLYAAP